MQARRNNNRGVRINEAVRQEMTMIMRELKDPRIDLMTSDQKALGVDAVRGTGQKGAVIFSRFNANQADIVWFHDADLIHLVGNRPVQNGKVEGIADLHAVKVSKQHSRGKSTVGGNHAMGTFAAHWQAAAFHMTHSDCQHIVTGAVIDRQFLADLRHGQITHHTGTADIQGFPILVT